MRDARARAPRARFVRWVIFPLTLLLLLCSLLVLLSAPTEKLWIVAIVAGELGHYAAVVCLVLAVVAIGVGRLGVITAACAVLAACIFSLPAIRAASISHDLPRRCTAAFGTVAPPAKPFDLIALFRGIHLPPVNITEHEYAKTNRKSLKLDLYRLAAANEPQPLIIMIHGGSWNGGSKAQLTDITRWLAAQRYTVASINYRHAPKWRYPAQVDDVFLAIDFLRANAQELRIDPTAIVLIGRSAGGQIALSAAYSGREPAIRGVVSFYAPTDLVVGYEKPSRRLVLDSKKVLEDYLGGSPREQPDVYQAASPVRHVDDSTPATLLIHGELDPMVWSAHAELLHARLEEARRPNLYLALPWATHGCEANISGPSGQLSLYAIQRFLAAVFDNTRGVR